MPSIACRRVLFGMLLGVVLFIGLIVIWPRTGVTRFNATRICKGMDVTAVVSIFGSSGQIVRNMGQTGTEVRVWASKDGRLDVFVTFEQHHRDTVVADVFCREAPSESVLKTIWWWFGL